MAIFWVATFCIQAIAVSAWRTCLECSTVVDPADCTTITRCGQHEECYTEMWVNSIGGIRYSLGCRDSRLCGNAMASMSDSIITCSQCCTGELCNNAGCQGAGYPTRRGPVCINCQMQANVDDCNQITMCAQNEVCMLKKTLSPITKATRYQTGCQAETACNAELKQFQQISAVITGKRQAQTALHVGGQCIMKCCNTDVCNDNCNETSITSSDEFHPVLLK